MGVVVRDLVSPVTGVVTAVTGKVGQEIAPGVALVYIEAMKMEFPVEAPQGGQVADICVNVGDSVAQGDVVARLGDAAAATSHRTAEPATQAHPGLATLRSHRTRIADEARPSAMAKRHARGHRSVRENIADFVADGTFHEYGSGAVAAQRSRRTLDDLEVNTPADGIITGLATWTHPDAGLSQVMVLGYDYTVLAGTQGYFNHKKADRALRVAAARKIPVVLFAEGGGGRPGDVDAQHVSATGLDLTTFGALAGLSGRVPLVAVVTGWCFAGNAALAGCCDVIVATGDSSIGMAGPAMIEGGGLGRFRPEEVGPMSVQSANGVVDLVVDDDAAAVAAARTYVQWAVARKAQPPASTDQDALRSLVPANRKQIYDIRTAIDIIVDEGSFLELRANFARNAITGLARLDGRSIGVMANFAGVLGGAIDADAGDKFARFMQVCDAHGIPLVSLCDTPGFMVGPDAEQDGTVRHVSRMFLCGARLSVPRVAVITRKGYGLGAMAMAFGSFATTDATLAWPSAEIGAMGLEGAVRLGYSKELAAIGDKVARQQRFDELVDQHYANGTAFNAARLVEVDEVIDPAETRERLTALISTHTADTATDRWIDAW